MNYITKTFAVLLIPLLTLNLCLPGISSAEQGYIVADVRTAKAEPEILATPEEDIPVEKIEKGGVSWLWILVGVAAVGGIAAAAGGGGGGGSSSPSSTGGSSGGTEGTLTVPF